ncbi:unnamed protein product [Fusarium graminearum]|nr:unnamed protein product [Fusarium graminearum]
MDIPSQTGPSGPGGYFVISSHVHCQSHLPNPMCVDASRCRACLFPIELQKELIVACKQSQLQLRPLYMILSTLPVTPEGQVSTSFLMHQEDCFSPIYLDKTLNVAFRQCLHPSCTHTLGLAVTFHADCARIATLFKHPLVTYCPFTEYSFQPSKAHLNGRRESIRILIENSLQRTYGNLSPELWRMVSDDDELIRLYTIAEITLICRKSEWSADLATPVWATHITVDGVEYVSSLSRSPTHGACLAWNSVLSSDTRCLYVSSDHLGIRQIISDMDLAQVNVSGPVYWQTLSVERQTILFAGDGYKLREVSNPSPGALVQWPLPVSPLILDSLSFYYAGWGEGEVMARMKTLTFNQQGTFGYSVCWSANEMVSIHANRAVEEVSKYGARNDEHSEYNEHHTLKWTYHPIEEDEYVQQVWLRGSTRYNNLGSIPCWVEGGLWFQLSTPWGIQKYKRPSDIALGLVTNKGRLIMSGSYPDHHGKNTPYSRHREWMMIAKAITHEPITLYFSPSSHGIPIIASPKLPENVKNISLPEQTALGPMPRFNPLHTLHYSAASLEDVTSVTIFRSKSKKDTGIIRTFDLENSCFNETKYNKVAGLLLRYADGREASVGCFRVDTSEAALVTSNSEGLFVGTRPGTIAQLPPHVAVVSVARPEDEGEWAWKEFPWSGTLEWWFNPDNLDTSINHVN